MNCQHKTEGLAALRENFNILTEKGQLLQYKIFRLSPFNVSITHRPFEKKKFYLKNVSDRDGSWTKEKVILKCPQYCTGDTCSPLFIHWKKGLRLSGELNK